MGPRARFFGAISTLFILNLAPWVAADTGAAPVVASCQRRHPDVRVVAVQPTQGSTIALLQWANTTAALIADEDDAVIHTIDVTTTSSATKPAPNTNTNASANTVHAVTPLSGTPSQLLVLPDGRVAVALRDKNRVQLLEPTANPRAPLTPLCEVEVAAEPVGLAATPDGSRVLVTSGWGRALTIFDAKAIGMPLPLRPAPRVVDLPRDPRGVLVDDAGAHAFVSHVVGGTLSIVNLNNSAEGGHEIALDVAKKMPAFAGGSLVAQKSGQGFALAKSTKSPLSPFATVDAEQKRIFLPMAVADPGEPKQISAGYGSGRPGPAELPFVGVVDLEREVPLVKEISGEDLHRSRECLLPRAAAYIGQRKSLLVACMGIDMLVELDATELEPARKERSRWRVGAGPTGIALDKTERIAVVWSQFDHAATIVTLLDPKIQPTKIDIGRRSDLSAGGPPQASPREKWELTASAAELTRGRILFHKTDDARLSRDGRACASCHPDGREDALTWSTPNGPRQTIMLAGRTATTAPYSWSGTNATLDEHVTGTFQRLGGTGIAVGDGDLRALLSYVGALRMPPPPTTGASASTKKEEEREALVLRGKVVFFGKQQGCSSCHLGGNGTDGQRHQVGSSASDQPIDTPSLRFVGGTAPYFHDGRFATLDQMLTSTDHTMANTRQLDVNDRRALIAYLETL